MAGDGISRSGVSVRLAYLCNLYPAVSHSFVRREIEGVEAAGHEVYRFSLRPPRADLRDEADIREAARTEVVLDQGALSLFLSAVLLCFSRPTKSVRAFAAAVRLSGPGLDRKFRHLAYWLEAAWLTRRLERLRVEHVHAHFGTNPAAVALITRAWGGPPFSFTAHGPNEFDAPVALSLGQKIEAASFVVAISSYGRSQLMRWCAPAIWNKIKVIRCGLDPDYLAPAAVPVSPDSTELLCVARLSAQKGLPLLVAACDRLRGEGKAFTLTIVGDGELRSQLQAEIAAQRLSDRISLAGICSSAEIREHLLRARAFVLPSFAEGLPVVIMEALALARPVVATEIAGIPELVDSDCGWLVTAGSEEALAIAISKALRAPAEELNRKGAVGRERVHRMHDARRNAEQVIAAIAGRSAGESLVFDDFETAPQSIQPVPEDS
jgi:glycosyltransferase involved in cell wall biosynthesis